MPRRQIFGARRRRRETVPLRARGRSPAPRQAVPSAQEGSLVPAAGPSAPVEARRRRESRPPDALPGCGPVLASPAAVVQLPAGEVHPCRRA